MLRQHLRSLLVSLPGFFVLLFAVCARAQEQDPPPVSEDIFSDAMESVRPSPGLSYDRPPQEPTERPESRYVDEETWDLWKKEALGRPDAAPPDSIVAVEDEAGIEAVLTSFPGMSWSNISPSDVNLAKSGTRVLQVANSQIKLFGTTGTTLAGRTLADFFGAPDNGYPLLDPRVLFDRLGTNQRFYVLTFQYTPGPPKTATLWLAVSRSANPANLDPASWCLYAINALRNAGTGDESYPDFPGLGVGTDTLLLSTNQHRFTDNMFTYAILRAINKVSLANNAAACPGLTARVFQPSTTIGNLDVFTLQPAVHSTAPSSFPGTANPVYAVSASGNAVGTTYRIFRVRNVAGGNPTLNSLTIKASSYYALPPNAPQNLGGTVYKLDTGDARIRKVAAVGDALWASQSFGPPRMHRLQCTLRLRRWTPAAVFVLSPLQRYVWEITWAHRSTPTMAQAFG